MYLSVKKYKILLFLLGILVFVGTIFLYLKLSNQPKADVITGRNLVQNGYISSNTYLLSLDDEESQVSVPPTTSPTIPSTSTTIPTTSSTTTTTIKPTTTSTTTTVPVITTSDLVLTQLTVSPATVQRGRNEVFTFTIKNNGNQKESNIQLNIYDKNGKRFNSKTAVITSLDVGITTTVSITQKISQFTSRGQNIVTGKIEPVLNETNIANNSKETTFTIK